MHLFWKSIDSNYFEAGEGRAEGVEQTVAELLSDRPGSQANGHPLPQRVGRDWVSDETLSIVACTFTASAFGNPDDLRAAATNFKHFCLQLESTIQTYGQLMRLAANKRLPCEKCADSLRFMFARQWEPCLAPGVEETSVAARREAHIDLLRDLSPRELCQNCLFKMTAGGRGKPVRADPIAAFRERNRSRISQLLQTCEERKAQRFSLRPNVSVFREIECQKSFIQRTLLQLEMRILADSIFKVNYAKKNKKVEVLLTKPGLKLSLRLKDLLAMDKMRENSLFQVAKTSIKTHSSYYSYNVG